MLLPFADAPAALRARVGTLLPVAQDVPVWVLHIPAEADVGLLHCALPAPAGHLLVLVGERAHCQVSVRIDGAVTGSYGMEVFVQEQAQCTILCVTDGELGIKTHVRQRGQVGAGGNLQWQNVTLDRAALTQDLVSHAVGTYATSSVDWMFLASGSATQQLSVRNVFEALQGGGEIFMRGIAQEAAHVTCQGMIEIGLHGGGTQTYLTQEVLMLDPTSKVDAVPGLEIKTNDVKASHSATVLRISPEDLFTFAARGIAEAQARQMVRAGFLRDIAERIVDPHVREAVFSRIGVDGVEG